MAFKLSNVLKNHLGKSGVDPALREYSRSLGKAKRDRGSEGDEHNPAESSSNYYEVVTDFYEFGWGRSFHFAPRIPGESFEASVARHEHFMAHTLGLRPGMRVADLGCGVGGPMLEIARFSGAKIVGVNINAYQLEKARRNAEAAELAHLVEFLHCDFLNVDAPDESFDAVYSIEATCHAPDKARVYGEAFRLLKPGARFACYEYAMTDRFDPEDPHHLKIKADIEFGGGIINIDERETIDEALPAAGFEVLEIRDLAEQTGPCIPWYQPLVGSGISLAGFRSSKVGRRITEYTLKSMETVRLAPRGAADVARTLGICAAALIQGGRLGIFTPMYFLHARKPG